MESFLAVVGMTLFFVFWIMAIALAIRNRPFIAKWLNLNTEPQEFVRDRKIYLERLIEDTEVTKSRRIADAKRELASLSKEPRKPRASKAKPAKAE